MKCITRYELKFGDIIVPARTQCRIINKPDIFTVNAPGVQIIIVIANYDLRKRDINNENKIIKFHNNVNDAS